MGTGNSQGLDTLLKYPPRRRDELDDCVFRAEEWIADFNFEVYRLAWLSGDLVGQDADDKSLCCKLRRHGQQFVMQAVEDLCIRKDLLQVLGRHPERLRVARQDQV